MADDVEVFLIDGGTLFAVGLAGQTRTLSEGWSTVHSLASAAGRLWVMQQETLFLVAPDTGADEVHSRGWGSGVKRLAGSGDTALVVDGRGRLFSLDPQRREGYRFLSAGWEGVTALCATAGRFFAVDDGRLFELDPATGDNRLLTAGWGAVTAAAGAAGQLYLVSPRAGNLVVVDPATGAERVLSREWYGTTVAAASAGHLLLLDGRVLYEVDAAGKHRKVSEGWGAVACGCGGGD